MFREIHAVFAQNAVARVSDACRLRLIRGLHQAALILRVCSVEAGNPSHISLGLRFAIPRG